MGRFWIFLARVAYDRVDSVSSTAVEAGLQQAIMSASASPPNESIRSFVNLESLREEQPRRGKIGAGFPWVCWGEWGCVWALR